MKNTNTIIDKQGRRSFFWKAGTAVSAAMASTTVGANSLVGDEAELLKGQLNQLKAGNEIRQLHQRYVSLINQAGEEKLEDLFVGKDKIEVNEVSHISQYTYINQMQNEELDNITFSKDGLSAEARFYAQVQIKTPINGNSSSLNMALQQGQGLSQRWESGIHQVTYVKADDRWLIQQLDFRTV